MPSRPSIYLPDFFGPCCNFGDTVCLVSSTGPYAGHNPTPFCRVKYIEPITGIGGGHGAMVLWYHDTLPAGYTAQAGGTTGQINAGATTRSQPNGLQMPLNEILQFRFVVKLINVGAGPKLDDIDVQVYLPSAVGRMAVLNDQGRFNAMGQFPMPSDDVAFPAQAANIAYPTLFPVRHPADAQHYRELFVYEQQTPVFLVTNNGSANTVTTSAIAIYVWGWRYVLDALDPASPGGANWTSRDVLGQPMQAPPDYLYMPIGGRGR